MRTSFNENNELVLNVLAGNGIKSVTLNDLKNDKLGFCSGEMSVAAAYIKETNNEKEFAKEIDNVLDCLEVEKCGIPELELFDLIVDFYYKLYRGNKERAKAFENNVKVPVFVKIFSIGGHETERGALRHSEDLNIMLQNHVMKYGRNGFITIEYGLKYEKIFINEAYLKEMGVA